jgi:hypothetical protein
MLTGGNSEKIQLSTIIIIGNVSKSCLLSHIIIIIPRREGENNYL